MLEKEIFVDMIERNQVIWDYFDELKKLDVDMYESLLYVNVGYMFDKFMESHFTEDGCDWIFWWIYERPDIGGNGPDNKAWDEDGKLIPFDTVDDLWNFLVKNDYFKHG